MSALAQTVADAVATIEADVTDPNRVYRAIAVWRVLLQAIAVGQCDDPVECAKEVLKLRYVDFGEGKCFL